MSLSSRRRWFVPLVLGGLGLAASGLLAQRAVSAQQVVVDGPTTNALTTVTPLLQLRALGLATQRPLLVQLQISTTADFAQLVVDSSFVTNDTLAPIQVTRPLPSDVQVFWRLKVRAANGISYDSPTIGPRLVPPWLTLRAPNSASGNSFDIRRPLFVWSAAPLVASAGPWTFDLDITANNRTEVGVAGLRDTTFRPGTELQANTSYRWNVRASLRAGESIRVSSQGSFVITDPPLPTTTLLFQNFPNPFPSATSFSTCFWFDVGEPGATVKLDVLDIRGNAVRSIVPGRDGVSQFAAGRYGRGAPGSNSNCDNRFVWDGTADDGRTVAPGVYIARFTANNAAASFRRIVFRGR